MQANFFKIVCASSGKTNSNLLNTPNNKEKSDGLDAKMAE